METKNVTTEVCVEPLAREEMDEETFNAMMHRGLSEAIEGKSGMISDGFKEIWRDMR